MLQLHTQCTSVFAAFADTRRRPGFTLIELLVVIAVVALIVGMLLPALGQARSAAKSVRCLSQVRQLELAQQMYADAYKGALVDAALAHGGIGDPKKSWPVTLAAYTDRHLLLRSPLDASPYWSADDGGAYPGMSYKQYAAALESSPASPPAATQLARWTSYGLNNYTTRSKKPPAAFMARPAYDTLPRIPRPASTVHFLLMTQGTSSPAAAKFARSDHVHAETWDDGPEGSAPESASVHMEIGGHEPPTARRGPTWADRSAYGFLDGHAQVLRFDQVYTSYLQNRFYPEVAQ